MLYIHVLATCLLLQYELLVPSKKYFRQCNWFPHMLLNEYVLTVFRYRFVI